MDQFRSEWVDLAAEPIELIEAPDDRVLVSTALAAEVGRAASRSKPTPCQLCTIRDGKVRKTDSFRHRSGALEAAGLRE